MAMSLAELKQKQAEFESESDARYEQMKRNFSQNVETLSAEAERVADISANRQQIYDALDIEFEKRTGLTKTDVAFLFVATGLQIARQYLLTKFPDTLGDQESSKLVHKEMNEMDEKLGKLWGKKYEDSSIHKILTGEEHSDRSHRYYNPSLSEILSNPVPFDANKGANGFLKGGGHRVTAIGHDPILGLFVGTANIATSTITNNLFQSRHVNTGYDAMERASDWLGNKASTAKVIGYTTKKLFSEGIEGKEKVGVAFIKEIIHLKTDLNTVHSLPIPILPAVDSSSACKLASYGLNMSNIVAVGKQAGFATLINAIIGMVHGLFCKNLEDEMEVKLHKVRTGKILRYSNLIASGTNLGVVAFTQNMKLLDLGGLGVTLATFISSRKYQRQVKKEFLVGEYKKLLEGEPLNLTQI